MRLPESGKRALHTVSTPSPPHLHTQLVVQGVARDPGQGGKSMSEHAHRQDSAAAIRAHISICSRCRQLDARLAEMQEEMLGQQASRNMTATIAIRINRVRTVAAALGNDQQPPAPRTPSLYS